MKTEIITQSHTEPIALPLVGRWYQHFQRGQYRVIGNATHGEKNPDYFSYQAIYAPTLEKVSIVSVVGDVIHYQFTRYPEKNVGILTLFREAENAMLWARPTPNFLETIVYEGREVDRFTLVQP